ncbi:MAG: hypothetical protein C5B53_06075 [Candidatus Melainabacteria bacterium]|nr:MAG: hypothetical protein C5B53_06075 [Candidatus Melainabacteria bacterium]
MRAYPTDSTKKWLLPLLFAFLPWAYPAIAAHTVAGLQTDSPQELRAIAFRRHLERHYDTALDFYQKAIEKSTKEYGANSTYTGDLYFEMGMLAFTMSKFTTAEYCLTRAVQINPHAVVARLKLAELLRLREKPTAAQAQVQQSVERNANSPEARQQLVAWLQETNPAAAARHSFVLHQILLGIPVKQTPVKKPAPPKEENSGIAKKPGASPQEKPANAKPASKPATKPVKAQEQHKPQPAKSKDVAKVANNKAKPDKKEESKVAKAKQATSKASLPNDGLQEQTAQIAPVGAPAETKPAAEKSQPANKPSTPEHKVTKTATASPKPAKRSAHGGALVPPPPAMAIPVMMPPPGFGGPPAGSQAAHQAAEAKPAKKPTKPPAESKAEAAKAAPPEKHAAPPRESAGNASEDPDFLIEWASVKKQKKGASKPAPAEKEAN